MLELTVHAVRTRLRATLIWATSVGLVAGLTLASYAAFDTGQMEEMVKAFPKEMLEAFGTDASAYAKPEGYLATELGSYLPAVVAFFMINGAARAIAGAEHEGALDVVLSQPVPRWWVPVSSFLAGTIGMVIIAAGYAVLTFLGGRLVGVDIAFGPIAESAVALLPISLAFGGLATALSAVLRHSGAVTGTVAAVLVVLFLGNTLALLVDELSWMRWISPFHYYGAPLQDGLDLSDCLVLLGAAVAFVGLSIPLFARRDVVA